MKVFIVVDHLQEADVNVAVFSGKKQARIFIKTHKDDPYSPGVSARKYDCLDIEEFELDKP